MKTFFFAAALLTSTLFFTPTAQAQSNAKADIEKLIFSYRDALNASDANKVVSL